MNVCMPIYVSKLNYANRRRVQTITYICIGSGLKGLINVS